MKFHSLFRNRNKIEELLPGGQKTLPCKEKSIHKNSFDLPVNGEDCSHPRVHLNQNGMTLVEILLALGLTAFLTVATGSQMLLISKWGEYTNTVAQYFNLSSLIEGWISSDQKCGMALGYLNAKTGFSWSPSLSVTLPNAAGNQANTNISIYDSNRKVIASAGTKLGNLSLTSLVLSLTGLPQPIAGSTDTLYQGFIQLTATRPTGALGASSLTQQYPVRIRVNPSRQVIACSNLQQGVGSAPVVFSACNTNSVAVPSADYTSLSCKQVLCNNNVCGSCPTGTGGFAMVFSPTTLTYQCKQLTCPTYQAPWAFDANGYISQCRNMIY